MRTTSLSAVTLSLLMPVLALAQAGMGPNTPNQSIERSPLAWWWLVAIAVALAAFIWTAVASKRRGGPPSRTRTS